MNSVYEKIKQSCLLIVILFVVFINWPSTYSQPNLVKGYILENEFDTLHGFIDYRSDKRMSEFVDFYYSFNMNKTRYYPNQIYGYGLGNHRKYLSTEISIDDIADKRDTVFLELLVKGRTTLYSYQGNYNEQFFIQKDSLGMWELTYERIIIVDGVSTVNPHGKYLGILQYFFSDCKYFLTNPPDCSFNREALSRVVELYNHCSEGSDIEPKQKTPKITFNLGIKPGMSISKVDLSSYNKYPDFMNAEYLSKTRPYIGAYLETKSRNRFGFLSFILEIDCITRGMKTPENYSFYYSPIEPDVTLFVDFKFTYLDFIPAIKFSYEFRNLKSYIWGGPLYGIGLQNNNIIVQSNKIDFTKERIFSTEYNNELGLSIGIGCNYLFNDNRLFGFEIRFDISNAIPASKKNVIRNNSIIFAIYYQFQIH